MTPEEEYARRTFESHVGKTAGSSSSLTPGAGDATQVAKDGQPGSPSDSQPDFVTPDGGLRITLERDPLGVMVSVQEPRQDWHFIAEEHRQMARAAIRVALKNGIHEREIMAEYERVRAEEARG